MSNRKSDNLEFVPSVTPSKDEVNLRKQSRVKNSNQDVIRTEEPPKPREPVGRASNTPAIMLSLAVFVIMSVAMGYMYNRMQTLQQSLLQVQENSSQQVESLQDNFSKEGGNVEDKFKFLDSEIRKLWDVSNKRNKAAIEQNNNRLSVLQKKIDGSINQNKAAVASMSAEVDLLKTQQSKANKMDGSLLALESQIEVLKVGQANMEKTLKKEQQNMAALESTLKQVSNQVGGASSADSVTGLQNKLTTLSAQLQERIQTNEQAIKAIDAHRAQVNRNLERMQQENERLYRLVDTTLNTPGQ